MKYKPLKDWQLWIPTQCHALLLVTSALKFYLELKSLALGVGTNKARRETPGPRLTFRLPMRMNGLSNISLLPQASQDADMNCVYGVHTWYGRMNQYWSQAVGSSLSRGLMWLQGVKSERRPLLHSFLPICCKRQPCTWRATGLMIDR